MLPPTIEIAILTKAPIPGYAKTRLIPSIGAHAAAVLQERLTARTIETALAPELGPVTLWCAPDASHASFRELQKKHGVSLAAQPSGDLGARMLAAMQNGSTLVIGTDCPALNSGHLQQAADALGRYDLVVVPAEDGGYVLIGTREPQPDLFERIAWSTPEVMQQTRARAADSKLRVREFTSLWDIDIEDDLARMEREFPDLKL
jgi:rSAM/selenodomain-associated transferase 1